jgi:hypothetical protein
MGKFKQISKCCSKCGVEWDETLSNKIPKRAVCIPCYQEEGIERRVAKAKWDKEHRFGKNRVEKYKDYKVQNRQPFWKAINKEIKPLKDRVEIRAFISKQMDRIIADQQLMDYINDTDLIEKNNDNK